MKRMGGESMMRRSLKAVTAVAGVMILGVATLGTLMAAQAYVARRREPEIVSRVQVRSWFIGGDALHRAPLELAMVGDSLAAGLGADEPSKTVGVLLAEGLAAASERQVHLRNVAVVGAESKDLAGQIGNLTDPHVHLEVVVIVIGGNDVMHLQKIGAAVQYLAVAVSDLRSRGCQVIVATCPDMGTTKRFDQPLRLLAHFLSRLLATAQTIVVLRAGGRTVSMGDTLGPSFKQNPAEMFAADQVHPSSQGYARAAEELLSVCAAAGVWGGWKLSVPHRVYRRESHIRRLAPLAFWAVRHPGAETSTVPGTQRKRVHVIWRRRNAHSK